MELNEMEKVENFTNHRYIIKMMNPCDWVRHYNEGEEVVNDFILPRGPRQKDELSDTIYHAGTKVPYHYHEHGFETFEIAKGSVDCVVNGVRFIAQEGDLIHLPPYTAHDFIFLEEGTIWRELFQEMDMSGGIFEKNMVNAYYESLKNNQSFMTMYRAGKTIAREDPIARKQEPVDHSKVFQCRTPDFSWVQYDGDGYSIKQKIGKWETAGCKEIWHADVKKGLKVDYLYPHAGYDLYYVQKGKLEVTIYHTHAQNKPQVFIAEDDTIIDIPPYHTYTIKVLEDTAMYNYGGEYDLAFCLEDLKAKPDLINDRDSYLDFLRKYKVYATNMEYHPE